MKMKENKENKHIKNIIKKIDENIIDLDIRVIRLEVSRDYYMGAVDELIHIRNIIKSEFNIKDKEIMDR